MRSSLIEKFAPVLCDPRPPVVRDPRLLMDASGDVKIYYAPFEYINPSARIVLVGITPGPTQMVNANNEARRALQAGKPSTEARDKTDGLLQPRTAETGRIGCYYPVSLSIFDLSTEAPVHGLPTQPDAAIGIPWRDLTPVISNGTSKTPQCFDSAAVQDTKVERI